MFGNSQSNARRVYLTSVSTNFLVCVIMNYVNKVSTFHTVLDFQLIHLNRADDLVQAYLSQ